MMSVLYQHMPGGSFLAWRCRLSVRVRLKHAVEDFLDYRATLNTVPSVLGETGDSQSSDPRAAGSSITLSPRATEEDGQQ